MRLVLSFVGMWVAFTLVAHVLVEASGKERLSIAKAVGFGFCTALLTALVTAVTIVLF